MQAVTSLACCLWCLWYSWLVVLEGPSGHPKKYLPTVLA